VRSAADIVRDAHAIAAAAARGDRALAVELAAALPAPTDAVDDARLLARTLAQRLRDAGAAVPPGVAELADPPADYTLGMSELANELADPDLFASRVPGWLPTAGVVFVVAAMALALWVGRHSLGFIDPPPDCRPPAGATHIAAARFDDACRVLSWQTEGDNATWIIERDDRGTPRLATRSAANVIFAFDLDAAGNATPHDALTPAALAKLRAELYAMLPPKP
jgi:hypothetical protein